MMRELHRRPEGCPSDLAFDRQLAGELVGAEKTDLEKHTQGCDRCGRRLVELQREKQDFERDAPALVLQRARARVRWLWGAGGVVAAAAAVLLFVRSGADTTRTKGRTASLGFYVNHAGGVRVGAAGERVEPGDALRFVATTREPRYLAIFSLDGARHASVYFPEGPRAAPVDPGQHVALPASTVLDDTLGDETLYGVFCVQSFEVEPLRRALSAAPDRPPAVPNECEVDATHVRKEARTPR